MNRSALKNGFEVGLLYPLPSFKPSLNPKHLLLQKRPKKKK